MSDVTGEFALIERPGRLLNFEFRVALRELTRRSRRIVGGPFRLTAWHVVQLLHDAIHYDDIGTGRDQGSICFKLREHEFLRVVGIQQDHDCFVRPDQGLHSLGYHRIGRAAFDKGDERRHLVRRDSGAIVGSDLDIDPEGSLIECLIDLNPHKQGAFVPLSGHPIVEPATAVSRGVRTAIVMNPNYVEEIQRMVLDRDLPLHIVTA